MFTETLKSLNEAFKDLAVAEAFKFNQISPRPKLFFHHRKDGDADYLGAIIAEINDRVNIIASELSNRTSGLYIFIKKQQAQNKV